LRACTGLLLLTACGRISFDAAHTADARTADGFLRLDRVDPGEVLVDFPLPVRLPIDPTLSFYVGGAPLPFEIDDDLYWVRVPEIRGLSTVIELRHDGARSAEPVWTADHEAVWHMGAGNLKDSTGHDHVASLINTTDVPAQLGIGQQFVKSMLSYAGIPDSPALSFSQITLSAWRREPPNASTFKAIIGRQLDATTGDDFYLGVMGNLPLTQVTSDSQLLLFGAAIPTDTWIHLASTYDGTTLTLYVDGVVSGTPQTGSGPLTHSPQRVFLGADCDDNGPCPNVDFQDAILDELRIERVARSAAWIRYEVASGRDEVITLDN
jgi:hypothetical protein